MSNKSSSQLFLLDEIATVIVIVESELDAVLVWEKTRPLVRRGVANVGVVAMGSADARPDAEPYSKLKEANLILCALNADAAGAKSAWKWWMVNYPANCVRWPPVGGCKNPGEMLEKGLSLADWIYTGLVKHGRAGNRPGEEPMNHESILATARRRLEEQKNLVAYIRHMLAREEETLERRRAIVEGLSRPVPIRCETCGRAIEPLETRAFREGKIFCETCAQLPFADAGLVARCCNCSAGIYEGDRMFCAQGRYYCAKCSPVWT